jgi:hypothetical protein
VPKPAWRRSEQADVVMNLPPLEQIFFIRASQKPKFQHGILSPAGSSFASPDRSGRLTLHR